MKRILTILLIVLASQTLLPAKKHRPEPQNRPHKPHHGMVENHPRSMGFRIGVTGFDASYQHSFRRNQFLQGDFGVDFGYNANGRPGVRAAATYNFLWARPAWTHRGYWGIYSGPGVTMGYVNDLACYRLGNERLNPYGKKGDYGFMMAFVVNVGLEYTFEFPVTLALEVRPAFGVHFNGGYDRMGEAGEILTRYSGGAGFYENGLLGFVPTFTLRYRF